MHSTILLAEADFAPRYVCGENSVRNRCDVMPDVVIFNLPLPHLACRQELSFNDVVRDGGKTSQDTTKSITPKIKSKMVDWKAFVWFHAASTKAKV